MSRIILGRLVPISRDAPRARIPECRPEVGDSIRLLPSAKRRERSHQPKGRL